MVTSCFWVTRFSCFMGSLDLEKISQQRGKPPPPEPQVPSSRRRCGLSSRAPLAACPAVFLIC